MTTNIWWLRRDLRLFDNPALDAALQTGAPVVPLFILDERLHQSPYMSEKRFAFLWAGLHALDESLRARGSYLLVRRGEPLAVLSNLLYELGGGQIFAQADYSPYAVARDTAVSAHLPLTLTDGVTIRPPTAVGKENGDPYTVFTPYKKRWLSLPLPQTSHLHPTPDHIPTPPALRGDPIPTSPRLPASVPFVAGETEGRRRLHQFVAGAAIANYAEGRNMVDTEGTAQISPYVRFGMVSAREAAVLALAAGGNNGTNKGAETWLSELIWREFFVQILARYPAVRRHSFQPGYRQIPWRNDPAEFAAWCAGQTGYPIVDAGMRQLVATGWMHNRARMIVASFLVKDLLIDWRWGEKFFMQHLLDGDPAANNGGWQWTAGTGTDAAPYFRIFNPTLQSVKFDLTGAYIRRWVPELAGLSDKLIHEPGRATAVEQHKYQLHLGTHYPHPIVDHATARDRTLAVYKMSNEQGAMNKK
jgi:deoxyribodipyrimidine photo-lyase